MRLTSNQEGYTRVVAKPDGSPVVILRWFSSRAACEVMAETGDLEDALQVARSMVG